MMIPGDAYLWIGKHYGYFARLDGTELNFEGPEVLITKWTVLQRTAATPFVDMVGSFAGSGTVSVVIQDGADGVDLDGAFRKAAADTIRKVLKVNPGPYPTELIYVPGTASLIDIGRKEYERTLKNV